MDKFRQDLMRAGMKILAGNYTGCLSCGDTKKNLSPAGYCLECWTTQIKPGLKEEQIKRSNND